jgi:L-ascorbate metabolism protein UlaG (beta-lactamase superfamily)
MLLTLFLVLIAILALTFYSIGVSLSGPKYRGPVSDHFNGSRFINYGNVKVKGGMELLKWMFNRKQGRWHEDNSENYCKHPLSHYKGGIRITFVNHSTFLIQADGLNILTDPVWSKRVSPFSWIGPKRMKLPGIKFEDLPKIHVVLLTHNHYDHLDLDTLRTVFGAHHPKIITPLGVKALLDHAYISGAADADWWDEILLENGVNVQMVPAQHFSGRGFLDRDATLWCGYVIRTNSGNVYFAGDTGYHEQIFKDIGLRCAPVKVSLLPIGAYKPSWFMSPIHTSPEESIKIHREVKSLTSIGMHFGTFPLADDGCDDPVIDLKAAMEKCQLKAEEFLVLKEGEFRVFE